MHPDIGYASWWFGCSRRAGANLASVCPWSMSCVCVVCVAWVTFRFDGEQILNYFRYMYLCAQNGTDPFSSCPTDSEMRSSSAL